MRVGDEVGVAVCDEERVELGVDEGMLLGVAPPTMQVGPALHNSVATVQQTHTTGAPSQQHTASGSLQKLASSAHSTGTALAVASNKLTATRRSHIGAVETSDISSTQRLLHKPTG